MLKLMKKYFLFNLSAGLEYRASFLVQVFGMALNNTAFLFFWLILFDRIGGDINGYGFRDVMFLWALAAVGYGLFSIFLGNGPFLSRIIYQGELDVYLLQPRPLIPHLLCSRMNIPGWGDIVYGLILFGFTQPLLPGKIALFLLFSLLMALLFASCCLLYHSLTFSLGNAESFAGMATELIITFVLYPGSIFQGPSVWILHTLVPAALLAWIPAQLFRTFELSRLLLLLGADFLFMLLSLAVFRRGLRSYASGNRIGARL